MLMKLGIKKRHSAGRIIIPALCLIALIFGIHKLLKRAEPVFVAQCSNYSNTAFTDLVNKCVIELAQSDDFGNFFFVPHGSGDKITALEADTGQINLVTSKLLINIQNALNGDYPAKLKIPLGSLTGYYVLFSAGPRIPVTIEPISIVNGHYEEEFESVGINQVMHKINLRVTVDMVYRGYMMNERETIEAVVPIAETVISGNVPEYYGGQFAYSK